MTERRRFLRFETAFNALCEIVDQRYRAPYRVKNVSKEGALIVIDKKLKEGDRVNVFVDVPGDNMPIFASCQVAWQGTEKSSLYETGLKFMNINSLDKSRLLEYIYLQWLRIIDKR